MPGAARLDRGSPRKKNVEEKCQFPVLSHAPEVRDRPKVASLHRVRKDEQVFSHFNRSPRRLAGGGRICTPERFPRQEPATRKLLKLQSRPTLCGPVFSISSITCCH